MHLIDVNGLTVAHFAAPMCEVFTELDVIATTEAVVHAELEKGGYTIPELMAARGWDYCPPEVGHALSDYLDQKKMGDGLDHFLDHRTRYFFVVPRKLSGEAEAIAA